MTNTRLLKNFFGTFTKNLQLMIRKMSFFLINQGFEKKTIVKVKPFIAIHLIIKTQKTINRPQNLGADHLWFGGS